MRYVCPLYTVENIERSKKFYVEVLHQNIKEDYGENVVFGGDFSIHLRSHYQALLDGPEVRQGGNNFELYFEESNLENVQSELKAAGVEFVHGIKTQPWQQRVLRVYDPDRNIIEIGESLVDVCIRLSGNGKTEEEIAGMTSLPMDYIRNALKNNTRKN